MNVLLFTDPHFTPKAEFSQPTDDGLSKYLHTLIATFKWIGSLIEEHRPEVVCCCGDVTETTGYVDAVTMKVALEQFKYLSGKLETYGGVLFVIPGNHDYFSTEHNIHNLEFLRYVGDNLVLIDKPTYVPKFKLMAVPWVADTSTVVVDPDSKWMITHMDVKGGYLYKTTKSLTGVDPNEFTSVPTFNGHQHNPQKIGDNFQNIGALVSRNFGDVDSPPRGVVLANIDLTDSTKSTWKSISNPHDTPFIDVVINSDDDAKKASWSLRRGDYANKYLRIRYSTNNKLLADQLAEASKSSRVELLPSSISVSTEEAVSSTTSIQSDPFEIFSGYVDSTLVNNLHLKDDILSLGKSILEGIKRGNSSNRYPLKFSRVIIKWYHSIGDLDLDLTTPGLIYVSGINHDDPYDGNGVGKSAIHEAIYWCLRGKSLRDSDTLINWTSDWCSVSVHLQVGDTRYRIYRSINAPDLGTAVKLYVLGDSSEEDISKRLNSDTHRMITDLLGRSDELLKHSVFLIAGLENRLSSISYAARVSLIEDITDTSLFSKAHPMIKDKLVPATNSYLTKNGETQARKKLLADVGKQLVAAEEDLSYHEANNSATLHDLEAELAKLREELLETDKFIVEKRSSREAVSSKHTLYVDSYKKLTADIKATASSLYSAKSSLAEQSARLQEVTKYLDNKGICSLCSQPLPKGSKPQHSDHDLSNLRLSVTELETRVVSITNEHGEKSVSEVSLQSRLNALLELRDKISDDIESKLLAKNKLAERIRIVEASISNIATLADRIRDKIASLTSSITEGKNELAQSVFDTEVLMYERDVLTWLLDAFSTTGIRAHIMYKYALPFLNSRIQYYASRMGQPCHLDWKENKRGQAEDKLDIVLDSRRTYRSASKGERMMVDLSIQCAFNDLAVTTSGSNINLLIADEVIDYLDETSVANFIDILKDKAKTTTVLLMAHKPFIGTLIPRQLVLAKSEDVTHLIQVLP